MSLAKVGIEINRFHIEKLEFPEIEVKVYFVLFRNYSKTSKKYLIFSIETQFLHFSKLIPCTDQLLKEIDYFESININISHKHFPFYDLLITTFENQITALYIFWKIRCCCFCY